MLQPASSAVCYRSDVGLTRKALDLRVICALSQGVQLPMQPAHLLPQALQLHAHIQRLMRLR